MFQIIVCKTFQVFRYLFSEHYPLLKALDLLPQSKLIHPWLLLGWWKSHHENVHMIQVVSKIINFPPSWDSCGCLKRPVFGQHSLRADLVARPRRCDMISHPLGYKEWTIMPKINCLLNWPWVDIYIYIHLWMTICISCVYSRYWDYELYIIYRYVDYCGLKLLCLSIARKHEWNSVFNQPGGFVLGEAKGVMLDYMANKGLLLKSSYGLQLVTHTETCIAASKFSLLQTILWETLFGNLWIDLFFLLRWCWFGDELIS